MNITKQPPKALRSQMETRLFTRDNAADWLAAAVPFQRPRVINVKVRALGEELKKNGGVIDGVITLGRLSNDKHIYVVDGQHRLEAFLLSGMQEAISDFRTCLYDSMAEMAADFDRLQETLVRMKADDRLRALEGSIKVLRIIRSRCPWIGYDSIRRNPTSPTVGMSNIIRLWAGSASETPTRGYSQAHLVVKEMDEGEMESLIKFATIAFDAWGRDRENHRYWGGGGLTLGLSMWLYRRLVLNDNRTQKKKATVLTSDQFKRCLLSISANKSYGEWVAGRVLEPIHLSPAFRRLRVIFIARMKEDYDVQIMFPQPPWASK